MAEDMTIKYNGYEDDGVNNTI